MSALIGHRGFRAPDAGPDLNDVALFVQVVQAASFSAAAKTRGVPVSTVSRRIARLEARLGTPLLERTTRKLGLTDVGRAYFTHAERALDELTQGSRHVRELFMEPRGRVRITAPAGLGRRVTAALAPYLAATPHVSIELDLSERRVDLIAEGFDIAIRAGTIDSPDVVARKLFESTRWLFASKDYLTAHGRPRRIADLTAHDLIATRASQTGAVWTLFTSSGASRKHRLAFKPRLFVNELMAAKYAAEAGMGITLLPAPNVTEGELERVLPKVTGESGGLFVLYPAHRSLTVAVRSCVDHLVAYLERPRLEPLHE